MNSVFNIRAILVMLITAFVSVYGQNKEIKVKFSDLGTVDMAAFKLSGETRVKISGSGAFVKGFSDTYRDSKGNRWNINDDTDLLVYGWVLNSDSRKVVWSLKDVIGSERRDPKGIFTFEEEKNLPAGEYEVYFTGQFDHDEGIDRRGNWWKQVFNSVKSNYDIDDLKELQMTISAPASSLSETNIEGVVDRQSSKAIVNLIRVGDDKNLSKGFTLKGDTRLRLYAIGEGRDESSFDYAWIYDVRNNKKVWDLNYSDSKHAGGADKNILFDKEINLPKGSYMVKYVTDDSHSFEEWNSLPPEDPQHWGISIWAASEKDQANVTEFNQTDIIKPVVEMVKVGDDELLSRGFTLSKETKLRVLAIGESTGGDMADGGWIIDADSRKTVWQMRYDDTEHAGGDSKNRMIDEEITLKKGNYIAYYSTDDSHSYFDWNAAAPFDQERYGLTIWTVNETDAASVSFFNEKDFKSANVIAEIVRVKDNDFESRDFTLDKETKVRVYSLGEGTRGGMADFGWIEEDATGKTVWEMTYRKTEHAGGAEKNRAVNEIITLPKGKYRIYYETDNSHSYKDWNSTPPDDQDRYGITITYENK